MKAEQVEEAVRHGKSLEDVAEYLETNIMPVTRGAWFHPEDELEDDD